MTTYEILLFFHIASVILWLGAGTTVALIGLAGPGGVSGLAELARWLGPRVFGPASLGALGFGLALVADGHWTFHPLWVKLGLGAFALSVVLNAGVRFPALRRAGRGANVVGLLRLVAVVELLVLYLTVLDMVAKPA